MWMHVWCIVPICVCMHVCTEVRGGPAPSPPVYPFETGFFIEPGATQASSGPLSLSLLSTTAPGLQGHVHGANQLFTWVLGAYSRSVLTIFKF